MREDVVVRTVSRVMIPLIQLFALYVILHGSSSAGGGFQGGVIFASAFILYVIAFGVTEVRKMIQERLIVGLSSLGLYVYAGIGLLCIVFGASYLNYGAIPLPMPAPETRGLMMEFVEMGIGITVMAVMTSIFLDISARED